MRARLLFPAALFLVSLSGCEADECPDACDAVWGEAPNSGRFHVVAGAAEDGNGSCSAPFADLEPALAAARSGGISSIVLGEGRWEGSWTLGAADAGLEIAGCGAGTVLAGGSTPGDGTPSVLRIDGAGADSITVRDLTIEGGRRSLLISGGAGAGGAVTGRNLAVEDPVLSGVRVGGQGTVAHLDGVSVSDPVPEAGYGYGVVVQTGGPAAASSPTVIEALTVSGASGAGLVGDGGWLLISSSVVSETGPVQSITRGGGELGRPIMLQRATVGELSDLTLSGGSDAGIAVLYGSCERGGLSLDGIQVSNILSSAVGAGDGMLFSNGPGCVTVSDVTFGNIARADVLADAMDVQIASAVFSGGPFEVVAQRGADVDAPAGTDVDERAPGDELDTDPGTLPVEPVDDGEDLDGDGVTGGEDCDDGDAAVFPGAPELCDGRDNDCDEEVDEDFDADGDGWTTCGGDCDDTDAGVAPGIVERCDNGIDDDCDAQVDESERVAVWADVSGMAGILMTDQVFFVDGTEVVVLRDVGEFRPELVPGGQDGAFTTGAGATVTWSGPLSALVMEAPLQDLVLQIGFVAPAEDVFGPGHAWILGLGATGGTGEGPLLAMSTAELTDLGVFDPDGVGSFPTLADALTLQGGAGDPEQGFRFVEVQPAVDEVVLQMADGGGTPDLHAWSVGVLSPPACE